MADARSKSEPLQPGVYNTQHVIEPLGISRDVRTEWYRYLKSLCELQQPEYEVAPVGNHYVAELNVIVATLRVSQITEKT